MEDSFNNTKVGLYRERVMCLFFACALLIGLEFLSRLVVPCQDNIGQILQILKQDSVLFWRQKPDLDIAFQDVKVKTNSMGLRAEEFKKEKPRDTLRIICLGASPTFGWGVNQEQPYPQRLEVLLKERYQNKNIEVINAGNIGYSSHQGLNFLKNDILKLSPDLITISYVINDVDKHRFYRSDGRSDIELQPKSRFFVYMENILDNSNLFKLLKNTILNSRGLAAKHFSKGSSGVYLEKRRVSANDYRKNLNSFINIARANNINVAMIAMPVNLPSQKIVSESLGRRAKGHLDKALEYIGNNNYELASSELKRTLEHDPYSSKALYYLGICSQKKNEFENAKNYFQKTKEMELYQCGRLGRDYNKIMEETANKNNIIFVNIASYFDAIKAASGEYLFLDPDGDTIHPNAAGHKIIASLIYETLEKYYFR